jgi:hypothetical protein
MSHEISKRVIGIWSISSFGDIMIHEEWYSGRLRSMLDLTNAECVIFVRDT